MLTNRKRPDRRGRIQLIDATSFWKLLRKRAWAPNAARSLSTGSRTSCGSWPTSRTALPVRSTGVAELRKLTKAAREFFKSFDLQVCPTRHIQTLADRHCLDVGSLLSTYSRKLRSIAGTPDE